MEGFKEIFAQTYLSNSVERYVIALVLFIIGIAVIRIFHKIILNKLRKWAESTSTSLDDFIIKLLNSAGLPLAYLGLVYMSINTLSIHPALKKISDGAWIAVMLFAGARIVIAFIRYGLDLYTIKYFGDESLKRSLAGVLSFLRIIIWGTALVIYLDNLGFKISAFLAGLGIGGVAVALAAQAVLKDLFSYFSIILDRPFAIGDFVIVGELMGTVEHIGIMTTRVTSLGGEQLVFNNTDLVSSRLRNYKRMQRRRVVFKLGVTYQTPLEKMKRIPSLIQEVIKKQEKSTFDRAHFSSYGDFSLNIEIVYYVESADYNHYMDLQQSINFAIMEEFKKLNIDFAYPTQTLYVNKENE